jgi:predicted aldo/keto reductase-like oxidoreductase
MCYRTSNRVGSSRSEPLEQEAPHECLDAQKAGKIRFIGFTGHRSPVIHLKMLATASKHGFAFDAVQMPLNVMDAHFNSFEKQVCPCCSRTTSVCWL